MPNRLSAWLHHGYKRTSSISTSPRGDQPTDGQTTNNNQILNVEPKRRQWHSQPTIVVRTSTSRIICRYSKLGLAAVSKVAKLGWAPPTKPNPTRSGPWSLTCDPCSGRGSYSRKHSRRGYVDGARDNYVRVVMFRRRKNLESRWNTREALRGGRWQQRSYGGHTRRSKGPQNKVKKTQIAMDETGDGKGEFGWQSARALIRRWPRWPPKKQQLSRDPRNIVRWFGPSWHNRVTGSKIDFNCLCWALR